MAPRTQYGNGMPVFVGRRIQRGRGLGGIFGSLAKRFLLPMVKNIGTSLLTSGLQRATGAIEDIGRGKGVKRAFEDQFQSAPSSIARAGARKAVSVLNEMVDEPAPKRRRKMVTPQFHSNKRKRAGRRTKDVFDNHYL